MLKIHRSANAEVVFTLSGRMDHESTAELETLIEAEMKGKQIILDLKDLTLAGQSDIDFLTRCEAGGIVLVSKRFAASASYIGALAKCIE